MDLRMAKMDGTAAIAQMRQRQLTMPILVLTTYDSNVDIRQAIEAGATGYLLKDASREQLFAAIRTVAHLIALLANTENSAVIRTNEFFGPDLDQGGFTAASCKDQLSFHHFRINQEQRLIPE